MKAEVQQWCTDVKLGGAQNERGVAKAGSAVVLATQLSDGRLRTFILSRQRRKKNSNLIALFK